MVPNYACPKADSIRDAFQSVPAWTEHLQENAALKARLDATLGTAGLADWASWCKGLNSSCHLRCMNLRADPEMITKTTTSSIPFRPEPVTGTLYLAIPPERAYLKKTLPKCSRSATLSTSGSFYRIQMWFGGVAETKDVPPQLHLERRPKCECLHAAYIRYVSSDQYYQGLDLYSHTRTLWLSTLAERCFLPRTRPKLPAFPIRRLGVQVAPLCRP